MKILAYHLWEHTAMTYNYLEESVFSGAIGIGSSATADEDKYHHWPVSCGRMHRTTNIVQDARNTAKVELY